MKVFIGCSSYDNLDNIYYEEAKKLSRKLIDKDCSLVFGGCAHGIMGTIYNEFKSSNKEIFAIQTAHYSYELENIDCNKKVAHTTLEQLECFMNESDLLMFLPGGYGTLNEIFYMISEYVNETHNKKIIIYNINHYFDGIDMMLNKIKKENFANLYDFVKIISNLDELDSLLEELC